MKSNEETYRMVKDKLGGILPEAELRAKAEIVNQIEIWKQKRNAVILGHNYMDPVLFHTIPDFVGDSLACRLFAGDEPFTAVHRHVHGHHLGHSDPWSRAASDA